MCYFFGLKGRENVVFLGKEGILSFVFRIGFRNLICVVVVEK